MRPTLIIHCDMCLRSIQTTSDPIICSKGCKLCAECGLNSYHVTPTNVFLCPNTNIVRVSPNHPCAHPISTDHIITAVTSIIKDNTLALGHSLDMKFSELNANLMNYHIDEYLVFYATLVIENNDIIFNLTNFHTVILDLSDTSRNNLNERTKLTLLRLKNYLQLMLCAPQKEETQRLINETLRWLTPIQ